MGAAAPASAAVILCQGSNCVQTDANVLVNSETAPVITGNYNNSDVEVTFTSSTETSLVANGNGQASVGALNGLLNQLTFTIESGFGFTTAIFNLAAVPGNALGEAVSVFINYTNANGTSGSTQTSVNTNGQISSVSAVLMAKSSPALGLPVILPPPELVSSSNYASAALLRLAPYLSQPLGL